MNLSIMTILLLVMHAGIAQNNSSSNSVDILMNSTPQKFSRPDTTYTALPTGDGYENAGLKSVIKYVAVPATTAETKKDFLKRADNKMVVNVQAFDRIAHGKTATIIVQEEVAPSGSGYENYILIVTLLPHDIKSSFAVVGSYPKSKDADLREKFIRSALSLESK